MEKPLDVPLLLQTIRELMAAAKPCAEALHQPSLR